MNISDLLLCAILTLVIVAFAVPALIARWVCRKSGHAWVNVGGTLEYRCKRCGRRFDMT
jgi:tRNA(Ile2) C34 agmatinyltransferase TiaS